MIFASISTKDVKTSPAAMLTTAATTWLSVREEMNMPTAISAAPIKNEPIKLQKIIDHAGVTKQAITIAYTK